MYIYSLFLQNYSLHSGVHYLNIIHSFSSDSLESISYQTKRITFAKKLYICKKRCHNSRIDLEHLISCFYCDKIKIKQTNNTFPTPQVYLKHYQKAELLLSFPFSQPPLECVCCGQSEQQHGSQCVHNAVQALDEPTWTPGTLQERQMNLLMRSMQHSW